jgi:phosphatidylserine/phosphatidylglycerophosphate/cardiolipin synthase-like enzyme
LRVIALSSAPAVLRAIGAGRNIQLASYILQPGRIARALEDAARRGARVRVLLEARPFGDPGGRRARENGIVAGALRRAGASVELADSASAPRAPVHIKAAVIDGVAFLTDRNWRAGEAGMILRDDDAADVRSLRRSLADADARTARGPATDKRGALALEAGLMQSARQSVILSSESFGARNAVYDELRRLALHGVRCRLVVNRGERSKAMRAAIVALEKAGVDVRVGPTNEKFCVVDGRSLWVGSANATSVFFDADQREWALRLDSPAVIDSAERRFATYWSRSAEPRLGGGHRTE